MALHSINDEDGPSSGISSHSATTSHDDDEPDAGRVRVLQALFFLGGISASTWGRFGLVYYTQKGLSSTQIGQIEGALPLVKLVGQPFWGLVADYTRSKKIVSLVTMFVSTAILMLLAFPAIASTFTIIMLITCALSAFSAPGVLDAYAMDTLGDKHKHKYGRIRLWLAVSWGIGALGMGYVNDEWGFNANFILYGAFALLSMLMIALFIPSQTKAELNIKAEQVRFSDLRSALCKSPVLLFFAECILFGSAMAVVERLLFIYLIRDLGGSVTLAGATVACTVTLEIPIFYYAQWLLHNIGHHALICCSMLAYFTRVYGYTLLTPDTVHYILALETLHGITFASFWISAVDYVKTISPPAFVSTFQTILQVMLACIGGGIGAFVGGWAMDQYGAKAMYRFAAYCVGVLFVLRVIGVAVAKCCCSSETDSTDDEYDVLPSDLTA